MSQQLALKEKLTVEVKPGQNSTIEIRLQERPASPHPTVQIELYDDSGEKRKRTDTGEKLLSFLRSSEEDIKNPIHVDINDGSGTINIPDGKYFVVFNNLCESKEPTPTSVLENLQWQTVIQHPNKVSVERIQYIRKEWIYQNTRTNDSWDYKKYVKMKWKEPKKKGEITREDVKAKWKQANDENDYYGGVFRLPPKPPLPPYTTRDMYIKYLWGESKKLGVPITYLRLTRVLFHSHKNSTRIGYTESLFQCCKVDISVLENGSYSRPKGETEQFVWTVYKGNPYIKLCGDECKVEGRTKLKVFVEEIGDFGFVVKSVTAEPVTKVASIEWEEIPEEIPELKPQGVQLVYPDVEKQDPPHRVEQSTIIGIALWKEEEHPNDIVAQLRLTAEKDYPFSKTINEVHVQLRAIQVEKDNREDIRFNGIVDSGILKFKNEPAGPKRVIVSKDGSEIVLSVTRADIMKVFNTLRDENGAKLHFTYLAARVARDLSENITKEPDKIVESNSLVYPIVQHVLIFLPGMFGTRLSVIDTNGDPRECWPETGAYIEWLVADVEGKSVNMLATNREALKVLDEMGIPFSIGDNNVSVRLTVEICHVKEIVEALEKTEFPRILLKNSQVLKHVIYREIPYDWRLCLDKYEFIPDENGLSKDEMKFPFLASLARSISDEFESEKKKAPFATKKLTLAGHSTGGVIIAGLVSLENVIKDIMGDVFYINVPFWGSPKAEYLMLTGIESTLNKVVNAEKFRQIATNLPLSYFLSPKERYDHPRSNYWSYNERKNRFNRAIAEGFYSIVPKPLDGFPKDQSREELLLRDNLDELAKEYDEAIKANYPNTVKSYIFFGTGRPTYSETKIPDSNLQLIKSYLPSEAENIISSLERKNLFDDELKSFKDDLGYDNDTGIGIFQNEQGGKIWQIYDINLLAPDLFYVLKKEGSGALSVYKAIGKVCVDSSLLNFVNSEEDFSLNIGDGNILFNAKIVETHILKPSREVPGDETVPVVSQLGLWYDQHQVGDSNVFVFPYATFVDKNKEEVPHMKAPNQEWIWQEVFKVFKQENGKFLDEKVLLDLRVQKL